MQKKRADDLTKANGLLKTSMMAAIVKDGEADEKGSLFLDLPTTVTVAGQTFRTLKRERRVSTSFSEDQATKILTKKGLLARCIKMVPTFDQDEVYVLNQQGLITDKELDSMLVESESWAFKPLAG
jgi:hypothetical protein